MKWKKFILLGDSNTQFAFGNEGRWGSMLADMLQRKCDVINRGLSGYSSRHVRSMMPTLMDEFEASNVCAMTLMFGSNDSVLPENKIQHCPLDEYGDNLRAIIDYVINDFGLDPKKLILITPPRIYDSKWKAIKESKAEECTHFDRLVKAYVDACRQVGAEKKIATIDLYGLIETKYGSNYGDLFYDGLHLSSQGAELLFSALSDLVKRSIEPDLRFQFPYHRDLKEGQTIIDQ